MPPTVLTKNKAQVPFWGDKLTIVRGLDPLGLQITSESTYGLLLPGLTNVTNRIRYYGFSCWLLHHYAELVRVADPERQQNFIRRAELLVALIIRMNDHKTLHIPGSEFADNLIANSKGKSYRLDEGADLRAGGNPGTYWKYRLGAFGQYYAGSLRALGLIGTSAHNDQVLVRTKQQDGWLTGEELAIEFGQAIPLTIQELFADSVESGRLNPADAKQLAAYFNLSRLTANGPEQAAYLRLLTAADYPALESDSPTYHRTTSLRLILAYSQAYQELNKRPHLDHVWINFLIDNYLVQGAGDAEDTRRGWYFYQLNEYWQFASSSLLTALLRTLEAEPGSYAHIPTLLTDFTNQIVSKLYELIPGLPKQLTLATFLQAIDNSHLEEENFVSIAQDAQHDKQPLLHAAAAFALLGKLYQRNLPQFPVLREYAQPQGILREGNFLHYAEQLPSQHDWPLDQFVRHFLHHDVIVRHQYVAMRKMGGGQLSTLKFEVEGEWFRCLEIIQARFSTPRLNILLRMAIDLGLLQDDFSLTARGKSFLA